MGVIVRSANVSGMQPIEVKIKNGSLVNVKILGNNGNGKYTGMVAGARVNITSHRILNNGDIFKAKIFVKDGTVFLSPVDGKENDVRIDNFPLKMVSDSQVFSFFKNLGLPSDFVMLNIFQMMKQLQMKFDISLFSRLHNIALRFNGKEKNAAEILMLLADKGINVSEKELLDFLGLIDVRNYNQEDLNNFSGGDNEKKLKNLVNKINCKNGGWFIIPFFIEDCSKEIYGDSYFDANGEKIVGENYCEYINSKEDLRILSKNDEKDNENDIDIERKTIGNGNIRILVDKNEKLQLLNVTCHCKKTVFYCGLEYKNGYCSKIKMNIEDLDKTGRENESFEEFQEEKILENYKQTILNLQKRIDNLYNEGKIKNKITVEWAHKEDLQGFSCENEEFFSINQKI